MVQGRCYCDDDDGFWAGFGNSAFAYPYCSIFGAFVLPDRYYRSRTDSDLTFDRTSARDFDAFAAAADAERMCSELVNVHVATVAAAAGDTV